VAFRKIRRKGFVPYLFSLLMWSEKLRFDVFEVMYELPVQSEAKQQKTLSVVRKVNCECWVHALVLID
jgi:hypothetical protein